MITLTNTSVVQEQIIGVPQLHIWGSEGARSAEITIPVFTSSGEPLEMLFLEIDRHSFVDFYQNYTSDKYLIDLVFAKYNIVADTSLITDFN